MHLPPFAAAALAVATGCSSTVPPSTGVGAGGLLVDASIDAPAVDDGGDHTFDLTIAVPCADSSLEATEADAVPFGVSAQWRMPDGRTFVRQLDITTTPRNERQPVRFCFNPSNGAAGIAETIGFLTGDAFYHPVRVQDGSSCVDALVAGGLTATRGEPIACDAGM